MIYLGTQLIKRPYKGFSGWNHVYYRGNKYYSHFDFPQITEFRLGTHVYNEANFPPLGQTQPTMTIGWAVTGANSFIVSRWDGTNWVSIATSGTTIDVPIPRTDTRYRIAATNTEGTSYDYDEITIVKAASITSLTNAGFITSPNVPGSTVRLAWVVQGKPLPMLRITSTVSNIDRIIRSGATNSQGVGHTEIHYGLSGTIVYTLHAMNDYGTATRDITVIHP